MSDFFNVFLINLKETTILEYIAVVFGLLSVWYARKANILVFPSGIISTVIYIYICFFAQLYADMGINFFYAGMSIYGWYAWTRRDANKKTIPIRWNSVREQIAGIAAVIIGFWIILWVLWILKSNDTDYISSYIPYIDAFTTAIFIVGMWFMARKRIENWIYWIIGDLISVPLYFHKGLVFTSFQFFVFLILAVMGLLEWKRMRES
ncbi:MAG: nicotinamide riboside transporter PnuC [Bacteroidetes bacterium]|nr:nicotinamide riboside transporter PnuC [Bacteroidota bacterium]